jgi:uncharacterized protein
VNKFLPRQEPIDAFGNGGFRFGGMSHLGSVLSLPSGMRAWAPLSVDDIQDVDVDLIVAERERFDHFLLGTGKSLQRPAQRIVQMLQAAQINFEFLDTGAAIHVYNLVLAERRRVTAALIAVEKPNER